MRPLRAGVNVGRLRHPDCAGGPPRSGEAAEKHGTPDRNHIDQRHENRRTADILGPFGQLVPLKANAINGRLDCRIQQFDHQDQKDAADHQGSLDAGDRNEDGHSHQDQRQPEFLPEGIFAGVGRPQPVEGLVEGVPHPAQASLALEGRFAVGMFGSAYGRTWARVVIHGYSLGIRFEARKLNLVGRNRHRPVSIKQVQQPIDLRKSLAGSPPRIGPPQRPNCAASLPSAHPAPFFDVSHCSSQA